MLCNGWFRSRGTVALVAAVLCTTVTCDLSAATFSNIVSFGDSLTDTGNIYSVTSNPFIALAMAVFVPQLDPPIPQAPYFERRFSNGLIWIDHLNAGLGFGPPIPSNDGGFNYAVGGAKTDSGDLLNLFFSIDIANQVSDYLSSRNPTGTELFVVEGGANDLLSGRQTDVTIPTMNLVESMKRLYDAGGRHFLVPNLPPLGKIPSEVGTPDEPVLGERTLAFNDNLSDLLDQFEANVPDVSIYRVDLYGTMQRLLVNPSQFGFTNLTDPAYEEGSGAVVPNPGEYLFWDTIHPTVRAHAIIGAMAVQAVIPEPSSMVGCTVLILIANRNRRSGA